MNRQTLHGAVVEHVADIATVTVPRALIGRAVDDELCVWRGRYVPSSSRKQATPVECIVKEMYVPLSRADAKARIERCKPLLAFAWDTSGARSAQVRALEASPFAALPVDFCRVGTEDRFDAAILPLVGSTDLEKVKRSPTEVPPEVRAALAEPINRARIVRLLALVLHQAQTVAHLPHLDVSDRNIRLAYDADARACRAYLIDWDEGLEATGAAAPRDEENYAWSPQLARTLVQTPWIVDALALIRYLLWIYTGTLAPVVNGRNSERLFVTDAIRQFDHRAMSSHSLAMRALWTRIASLAGQLQRGRPIPVTDVPRPVEFTMAVRAEYQYLLTRTSQAAPSRRS